MGRLTGLAILGALALAAPAPAALGGPGPEITIYTPADGDHYDQGAIVYADYECIAADPQQNVTRCDGTVPSGAPIDTSTLGDHAFTVNAADDAGAQSTQTVHYTVDTAPPPVGFNALLLARTTHAQAPSGPATDPALSNDGRVDRYAAYVSSATDIVAGSGSRRNVFLVARAGPWGANGTPWNVGATTLVSRGRGGPADGDSWGPAVGGSDRAKASCLAFVSAASNLVGGDTNHRADVFVRKLPSGGLKRIAGRGAVSAVAVSARCDTIAYVAGSALYVRTGKRTKRLAAGGVSGPELSYDGKTVVYERHGAVYARRPGGRAHRIGAGKDATADGFGRYVAFEHAGLVSQARIAGGGARIIDSGAAPSMTSGAHFVFYGQGGDVRLNVKSRPVASCPSGKVLQTASRTHGNYVVFTCSDGGAYLGYVGPR